MLRGFLGLGLLLRGRIGRRRRGISIALRRMTLVLTSGGCLCLGGHGFGECLRGRWRAWLTHGGMEKRASRYADGLG